MKIDDETLFYDLNSPLPATSDDILKLLSLSDNHTLNLLTLASRYRHRYFGNTVSLQLLKNGKSGHCTENCSYCAQSSISLAEINAYPLKSPEELAEGAGEAAEIKAERYCMALSGGRVSDSEIDSLCKSLETIKRRHRIKTCCSIGFITEKQARRLKEAGLDRINHNLNTSSAYYSRICTTHTHKDRIDNILRCKNAGLEICSGGIIGQGETASDRADFFWELREIQPDSIPVNFFIPVPGTPFASLKNDLTPMRCLKILSILRLVFPDGDLRLAGGREYHLRTLQPLAFHAVNSIFVRGYLTQGGEDENEALEMIRDAGFEAKAGGSE